MSPPDTRGLVIGKFMPPHLGHRYLVDFAANYADQVTILVCSLPTEPIAGRVRFDWMREMFPGCRVVHCEEVVPQEPSDDPDFWDIWRELVWRYVDPPVDYVFASEDYGTRLAAELDADFVPVDVSRELVPVSASDVRKDPMGYWPYIPDAVRPHYVRRICVFGPESTGKTTLARRLADEFDTVWVREYARTVLDERGDELCLDDMVRIARGQMASENALARQANRVLFCDTDPLTTTIWSEVLFDAVPPELRDLAELCQYDLYLVCDVDVPFVEDEHRYFPAHSERRAFFDRCIDTLERTGRAHEILSGNWDDRLAEATKAATAAVGPG